MNKTTATPSVADRAVGENATADTPPETGTSARLAYLKARFVVSVAEAGELTGLSRSTLLRAIQNGDLAATKVGARVVIPTPGLLEFVTTGRSEVQ